MSTSNNKTRLMHGFSVAILGIGLLASFPASAEKFYKWVDDAGSTHYTQTPPPKAYIKKSALVDIVVPQPSSTPPAPLISDISQIGGNNNQAANNQPAQQAANNAQLESAPPPAAPPKANY